MKLKTRLIIGFLAVTVLPLAISIAVIITFSRIQVQTIQQNYGITGSSTYETLVNPMTTLGEVAEPVYREISQALESGQAVAADTSYLNRQNSKLNTVNSYLVVREGDDIIYEGSTTGFSIGEVLPEYGNEESSSTSGTYIGGDYQVLIRQIDYLSEENAPSSIFVITDVGRVIPEISRFVQNMTLVIVLILVLVAGTFIIWIYRGVAIPLRQMQIATQNIKDGNLEYELEVVAEDEIGQLCQDFEEMRIRLKDNASEKVENDKRSKELISNISHDLKTPITVIKGYVEGIMDGAADTPEKMERYIKTIYNKANEMDTLINELTLYSKIDSNRIPYDYSTISVKGYFDDCAMDLQLELEERGIQFIYHNGVEAEVRIVADAEQLKRVINNIVSNSIKYMDKTQKKISLAVKDVGDFIQVEIEDNGKGIGAKELPYIFDRFYRTDASRNSSTGGSGIGLSIVKKIIEDHGGKIWATSKEGVGTGLYFVIRKYQEVPKHE